MRADKYPNTVVGNLDWLETPQTTRGRIAIAKQHALSLFGTGDARVYLSEKPLDLYSSPLRATVTLPANGSTLHGKEFLDVAVSDVFDVNKVEYVLTGQGRQGVIISSGFRSNYGYIGGFNTSTVPNGDYTIQAIVRDSGGRAVTTVPVEVRVENRRR